MSLRFYSTDTATVRDFHPVTEGEARLYYCGATVQGRPHIGHVRSALVFDQLRRWLEYRGFKVTTVRNVTDIDDKILSNSAASFAPDFAGDHPQEPWWALAYRFEKVFAAAYETLNIAPPTYEPRATGHIPEMVELISRLIERGHAYPALDDSGDVYFDVRSWPDYGSLTRQRLEDLQEAPDADPRGKRDPRDFALWKGHKEGEPVTASWESPWGRGRPGWHLECSAMAGKYLGERFDIHGGGLDLRFPHHENELAQSTAAGDGFAQFWLHNGLVTFEGEKMSKSIGNTVSPEQMLEQARPLVVRYYLGQAHYRSVLDYRPTSLEEARTAVERVESFLRRAVEAGALTLPVYDAPGSAPAGSASAGAESAAASEAAAEVPETFGAAMDDDLNVPQALAVLHETVRGGNAAAAAQDAELYTQKASQVFAMAEVLGLSGLMDLGAAASSGSGEHEALDALVRSLLEERQAARAEKDFARADAIRDQLSRAGVSVEDGASGSSWSVA